jgi:glycosyltransferase involved in cell wall biosynthesis
MKILLINDYCRVLGGAELQMIALRDGLRALGHEVRVFSSVVPRSSSSTSFADVHCYTLPDRLQVLSMWNNPFATAALRQQLQQFAPDLVHLLMYRWRLSPSILDALAGWRTILHIQTYDPICPIGSKLLPDGQACQHKAGQPCRSNGCLSSLAAPFLLRAHEKNKGLWASFTRRIAISEWQRKRLEADGFPVDLVIPNGVPLDEATTQPPAGNPLLVCASRLVREKGVDHLLRAFSLLAERHPNLHLSIAGDGEDAENLKRTARALPGADRITWLGYLERRHLKAAFAGAWLQVVPGLWEEPFGMATAEAMMRGLPVVAPSRGASAELLDHGAVGFLYANGDANDLARVIEAAIGDVNQLQRLGQAASERAHRNYGEQRMTQQFVELYEEVLR